MYSRVVRAIRTQDPWHIIFLEGDGFSSRFAGMAAPFDDNIVYSSHNYSAAGFGPGPYPGLFLGNYRDRDKQFEVFMGNQGTQFAARHGVPLWVGEFGAVYNGPVEKKPDRIHALDDQISGFEPFGAHWTTWTYKDVGVMGWVSLAPDSRYRELFAPILDAKTALFTDTWMEWLPKTAARSKVAELADLVAQTLGEQELDAGANRHHLTRAALAGYVGSAMQPLFARRLAGMNEVDLDCVAESFALRNCLPNQELVEVVKKYTALPA